MDDDSIGVIVHTRKPYGAVVGAIERIGGVVTYRYANVDGLAARIPAGRLAELQSLRRVDTVEKDHVIQLPTPREDYSGLTPLDMTGRDVLSSNELVARGIEPANYYSYLSSVTGAEDTWQDTGFGADTVVAVIDTGVQATHVCLAGRVIAGPDFSTDMDTGFEGSTEPTNNFHGTFVGGQIASNCFFFILAGDAFDTHLPPEAKIPVVPGVFAVPLLGIAPNAELYAVKVFAHTGAGAPTSTINMAIDHVITQKKTEAIDIDVVNMSLGGPSLNDGRSLNEMLVDAATDAGITMVIAAGNSGPSPNTVARAGTAYTAVTVAAATDPVHTRIFWDFALPAGPFPPDAGTTLYPTNELRVADFSGQGPYADARQGPDIIATGVLNFGPFAPGPPGVCEPVCGATNLLGWGSGTSFSTPQVAGAAALLNAWAENNDPSIGPREIRNALFDGAVPMDPEWSVQSQGNGFLNVPNSLDLLKRGKTNKGARRASSGGKLTPNVKFNKHGIFHDAVSLERGRWKDWVFEIDESTEKIVIEVDPGESIPPGPSGGFGFPESFELYVKSAKRGGVDPDFVNSANVSGAATVEIQEGMTVLAGEITGNLVMQPPATLVPGLMKVTLQSDWTNNTEFLSADVMITRVEGKKGNKAGGNTATIGDQETQVFAVDVPSGTTEAVFELSWKHDWTHFPTNDLDLILVSPSEELFFDGATLNSPEKQVIENPEAGTWSVLVDGFQVQRGRDPYVLQVTLKN